MLALRFPGSDHRISSRARGGGFRRRAPGGFDGLLALGLLLVLVAPLLGSPRVPQSSGLPEPPEWRFPVGERLEYGFYVGRIRMGRAVLEVVGTDSVRATRVHEVTLAMEGGPFFFRIHDRLSAWIAVKPFHSLRIERRMRQGSEVEWEGYELEPTGSYRVSPLPDRASSDGGPVASAPGVHVSNSLAAPPDALDELGLLYLLRSVELRDGETYRLQRYFRLPQNPVELRLVGREKLRTPAGEFRTRIVAPTIPGTGLFASERHARLWVTDDERRIVVKLTSDTRLGPLTLILLNPRLAGR